MKLDLILKTAVAGAAALAIAGCGGGGSGDGGMDNAGSVTLSGTAAIGAALANADVSIKCATGTGSSTTGTAGTYTVTIPGAALPCIIQVSGESGGTAITLHSIAAAGSTSGNQTTALANVTPISEMIVAQLTGSLPAEAFSGFETGQDKVTPTALGNAVQAIVAALKTAGIDLGDIDPLQATLVAANGTTSGNTFDQLLDALGEKVGPEALPLVVNQIANAAKSNSSEGLETAIQAVSGGTLEGCPSAVSGKYRVIDYLGAMQVVSVDFSKMKVTSEGTEVSMTANPHQKCEVAVDDGNGTVAMFGASGLGLVRDYYTTSYIFPVQSLAHADIVGDWHFVESGKNEAGQLEKYLGGIVFKSDRTATVCEYDVEGGITEACTPDPETATIADGTDGGLKFVMGNFPANFYGYRTPQGALTLFGTNNPEGKHGANMQTHFVAFKGGHSVPLPQVDEVRTTWGLLMRATPTQPLSSSMSRERATITEVDTANNTYSRVFDSSPTVTDVFKVNAPITGLVERINRAYIYAFALPGTGVTIAIDAPNNPAFLYSTNLARP